VRSSFLDIPHNTDNPVWQAGMRPSGLELRCPAEAGKLSRTLRHAGGTGDPGSPQAHGGAGGHRSPPESGPLSVDRGVGRAGVEPATLCLKAPVSRNVQVWVGSASASCGRRPGGSSLTTYLLLDNRSAFMDVGQPKLQSRRKGFIGVHWSFHSFETSCSVTTLGRASAMDARSSGTRLNSTNGRAR
jgi:hypothetical protein